MRIYVDLNQNKVVSSVYLILYTKSFVKIYRLKIIVLRIKNCFVLNAQEIIENAVFVIPKY